MRQGRERTIDHTPEVGFEKAPAVCVADFIQPAVNGYACVIDPCIDTAKPVDGLLRRTEHFFTISDICDNKNSLAAPIDYLRHQLPERFRATSDENQLGATFSSQLCRSKTNAA